MIAAEECVIGLYVCDWIFVDGFMRTIHRHTDEKTYTNAFRHKYTTLSKYSPVGSIVEE